MLPRPPSPTLKTLCREILGQQASAELPKKTQAGRSLTGKESAAYGRAATVGLENDDVIGESSRCENRPRGPGGSSWPRWRAVPGTVVGCVLNLTERSHADYLRRGACQETCLRLK